MVYERVHLPIEPGGGPAFEHEMQDGGLALLQDGAGCHGATIARGVEEPDTYLLLVQWDSVDAHKAWATTAPFDRFKAIVGAHVSGPPEVLHFEIVA